MPTPKFQKGVSGNPAGRPKSKLTGSDLRRQVELALPEILVTVIQAASRGDMTACKILIDKCIPTPKPVALPVTIETGADLAETGNNILGATLTGQIPPDVGSMLMTALANRGKLLEIDELIKRIEFLENKPTGD